MMYCWVFLILIEIKIVFVVKVGATAISDVLRLYFISSGAENAIDDVVPAAGSVLW